MSDDVEQEAQSLAATFDEAELRALAADEGSPSPAHAAASWRATASRPRAWCRHTPSSAASALPRPARFPSRSLAAARATPTSAAHWDVVCPVSSAMARRCLAAQAASAREKPRRASRRRGQPSLWAMATIALGVLPGSSRAQPSQRQPWDG